MSLYITRYDGWNINLFDLKTGNYDPGILVGARIEGMTYRPLFAYNNTRILSWASNTLSLTNLETGKAIVSYGARQVPTKVYPPTRTKAGQEFAFYQTAEGFWAFPIEANAPIFRRTDSKPLYNGNGWIFEQGGDGILKAYGSEYGDEAPPTRENTQN